MLDFNIISRMSEKEYLSNESIIESYIIKNSNTLVDWCSSNYNLYNLDYYGNARLYEIAIDMLFNNNNKYTIDNIKLIITYFSKEALKDLNIEDIEINFSKNKLFSDFTAANYESDRKKITFYLNKFEDLKNEDRNLLNSLMLIFNEIYRVKQDIDLKGYNEKFDINDYIMALEIINSYKKNFYRSNYNKLLKENVSSRYAFDKAVNYLNIFRSDLKVIQDRRKLKKIRNEYDYNIENVRNNMISMLEENANDIIEKNSFFVMEYPILIFGYEMEGFPKKLVDLIDDYMFYLSKYPDKACEVNNFYSLLIGKRFDVEKEELNEIVNEKKNEKQLVLK